MWNSKVVNQYGLIPTDGQFGVEVEVEGSNLPSRVVGWRKDMDGSLRNNPESAEYVLNEPRDLKEAVRYVGLLNTALMKKGCIVNNSVRTGIHIHMNCQELTMLELYTLLTAWYVVEEIVVDYCGEGRQGNLFCLRAKDAEYVINFLAASAEAGVPPLGNRDVVRYAAMNIASLGRYGSLEFRALNTFDNLNKLAWWLGFFDTFKTNVIREFDNPINVIEVFSMGGEQQFLNNIIGEGNLRELTKTYKDPGILTEKMITGVRLAQDIAFCGVDWMAAAQQRNNG